MARTSQQPRVVITGVGVLAANGIGREAFWDSLIAGRSGIGPVTLCDVGELPSRIAGEVKNFHPEKYLDGRFKVKHVSRTVQLTVAASQLALEDAGLDRAALEVPPPLQIVVGTSMGGHDFIEGQIRRIVLKGMNAMSPVVVGGLHVISASTVAEVLDVPARLLTLSNSCAGGLDAIAQAAEWIRTGTVDVALAGGSDAPIETSLMAGLCAARMLSVHNTQPAGASRPFDLGRDGGVLAEGSGMVVLENRDHALARGARPYLEVMGFGSLHDPTKESGSGLRLTMAQALANSGLRPEAIQYLCAHAPSDPVLDRVETEAIKAVFGPPAYRLPVSSIKGVTGNPLAAGGALQVIATALTCRDGVLPPTANYTTPDPCCDLDYVAAGARRAQVRYALVNTHGVGSINSSLVLGNMAAT